MYNSEIQEVSRTASIRNMFEMLTNSDGSLKKGKDFITKKNSVKTQRPGVSQVDFSKNKERIDKSTLQVQTSINCEEVKSQKPPKSDNAYRSMIQKSETFFEKSIVVQRKVERNMKKEIVLTGSQRLSIMPSNPEIVSRNLSSSSNEVNYFTGDKYEIQTSSQSNVNRFDHSKTNEYSLEIVESRTSDTLYSSEISLERSDCLRNVSKNRCKIPTMLPNVAIDEEQYYPERTLIRKSKEVNLSCGSSQVTELCPVIMNSQESGEHLYEAFESIRCLKTKKDSVNNKETLSKIEEFRNFQVNKDDEETPKVVLKQDQPMFRISETSSTISEISWASSSEDKRMISEDDSTTNLNYSCNPHMKEHATKGNAVEIKDEIVVDKTPKKTTKCSLNISISFVTSSKDQIENRAASIESLLSKMRHGRNSSNAKSRSEIRHSLPTTDKELTNDEKRERLGVHNNRSLNSVSEKKSVVFSGVVEESFKFLDHYV